jgi:hypothetical protein
VNCSSHEIVLIVLEGLVLLCDLLTAHHGILLHASDSFEDKLPSFEIACNAGCTGHIL